MGQIRTMYAVILLGLGIIIGAFAMSMLAGFQESSQLLAAIATSTMAIAAFLAVYATWKSVAASERNSNLNLLKSFLDEYSKEDMNKAGKLLRTFLDICHDGDGNREYAQAFANLKAGFCDFQFSEVDAARRRVKYYFFTARILRKAELLPDDIFKEVTKFSSKELLFDVSEPFEILDSKLHGGTYIESEWVEMASMLNYEARDTVTLETLNNIIPSVLEGMTPREMRRHI